MMVRKIKKIKVKLLKKNLLNQRIKKLWHIKLHCLRLKYYSTIKHIIFFN